MAYFRYSNYECRWSNSSIIYNLFRKDYEYIINDCKPKICIVSNNIQFKKIEKFISDKQKFYQLKILMKKLKVV